MAADDAILGAAGIPSPVAQALGDDGLGVTGLPFAAATTMVAGSFFGLFRPGAVALVDSKTAPATAAPTGFAQRLDRIPDPAKQAGAQVTIERYEIPGQEDHFEVYIAGTVSFDPVAGIEPWDLTSNIANAVGAGSGSYDSVVLAMVDAGIDESSPVVFTGYSQGGATAAQLAASGDYNTVGLVSFGGPTGQIALPTDIATVLVEHRDDVVPALGGNQENLHAVIVERDVFGGEGIPSDVLIPAHQRDHYRETAVLLDAARSQQVTAAAARLDNFAASATTVTSTVYRFERAPSPPAATSSLGVAG